MAVEHRRARTLPASKGLNFVLRHPTCLLTTQYGHHRAVANPPLIVLESIQAVSRSYHNRIYSAGSSRKCAAWGAHIRLRIPSTISVARPQPSTYRCAFVFWHPASQTSSLKRKGTRTRFESNRCHVEHHHCLWPPRPAAVGTSLVAALLGTRTD